MKKLIILGVLLANLGFLSALAGDKPAKPKIDIHPTEGYSLQISINDIPKNQQTLFIPIKIDTMVLDFDQVVLEGLSTQNILAVVSSSKDKVGPGIGLLKFDENGLPPSLSLKVLLKRTGDGQTSVSLLKVADEPALLSKGAVLSDGVTVSIKENPELEITEKVEKNRPRLFITENKITLDVKRTGQKEETVFIPLIFDQSLVDLDETFGYAIIGPGISAKAFSSSSLHEGGPGVEILLSSEADKDFSIDVDLIPKKVGKAKLAVAFPLKGHIAIVKGPIVDINPTVISVASTEKK
ncbi:MAG: hypothetical protein HY094_08005 [Candidatus Melainabacteria bacterium]|nr:hypothetical protein [Candidatus Melainabacteria bacterium]